MFGFKIVKEERKLKKPKREKELYDLGDILIKGASVFNLDAGVNAGLKAQLHEFVNERGVFWGGNVFVKNYVLSNFDITQSKCAHTTKNNIKPNVISFIVGNNDTVKQVTVCADCLYKSLSLVLNKE